MVSGATRNQPEVVDSVSDHVTTRLSPNDAPPYFLHYDTPDVTSSSGPPRCCDVTRRSGNLSVNSETRDLLTLEIPTLTSHGGAGHHLRLVGSRDRPQRCCSHLSVLPLLPPPPARTCVTWSGAANQLVDVNTPVTAGDLHDVQRRDDAAV